jgi:hypothetical protein
LNLRYGIFRLPIDAKVSGAHAGPLFEPRRELGTVSAGGHDFVLNSILALESAKRELEKPSTVASTQAPVSQSIAKPTRECFAPA